MKKIAYLAHLGVLDDPLHLVAAHATAIRISALARVHQRLDTSLQSVFMFPVVPPSSPYLNALESVARAALGPAVSDDALDGLHLVLVLDEFVAGIAQIEIVAGAAVPLGLAGALVARVVHFVRVRLVQGVTQTQR